MSAPQGSKTFAVHAACIRGVEAFPVTVEVSASGGIPGITIVGMADSVVMEARSRIRCALRAVGFDVPRSSFTVSLAPGDMRKTGSGLDLPIAVAVLALSSQIPIAGLDGCLFAGELALDGTVCGVRGEVAYQLLARDANLSFIGGVLAGHVAIGGVDTGCLASLGDLRAGIAQARRCFPPEGVRRQAGEPLLDYGDVIGQEVAKRGIAVAAAGGLGMLMVGSPGSGKTMLARRMTSILPPIGEREQQEALCIHSVVGESTAALLEGVRPFRMPHHSISAAGLVGRRVPGRSAWRTGACCFWMSWLSFPPRPCRCCGSRWRRGRCASCASMAPMRSRRASSCWRRATRARAAIWVIVKSPAVARIPRSSAIAPSWAVRLPIAST